MIDCGVNFPYSFWICEDNEHGRNDIRAISDWCNENCSGQWITMSGEERVRYGEEPKISNIDINIHSKAKDKLPISNKSYPPAKVDIICHHILIFELEEDATAFKLEWT